MENSNIPSEVTVVNVHMGEISMSEEEKQKHLDNLQKRDEANLDKAISKATEKPAPVINKINIFDEVFGKGYGQRFARVLHAGILDRFDNMASIVSYADQDNSLNDYQKKLAHSLEDAFLDAVCVNGPSKRLVALLETEPNLGKIVESDARRPRMYNDLRLPSYRLKLISVSPEYIQTFFTTMAICYGWKNAKLEKICAEQTGRKNVVGQYFTALLSKYTRTLRPTDYVNMWFVMMVIKNLSVCSITKKEVIETNPQLMDYAQNFFDLIDFMIVKAKHKLIGINVEV